MACLPSSAEVPLVDAALRDSSPFGLQKSQEPGTAAALKGPTPGATLYQVG